MFKLKTDFTEFIFVLSASAQNLGVVENQRYNLVVYEENSLIKFDNFINNLASAISIALVQGRMPRMPTRCA